MTQNLVTKKFCKQMYTLQSCQFTSIKHIFINQPFKPTNQVVSSFCINVQVFSLKLTEGLVVIALQVITYFLSRKFSNSK